MPEAPRSPRRDCVNRQVDRSKGERAAHNLRSVTGSESLIAASWHDGIVVA